MLQCFPFRDEDTLQLVSILSNPIKLTIRINFRQKGGEKDLPEAGTLT